MMTLTPKTIQIYLPEGDPRGIRIAEITTRIVRVVEIPRSLLTQFQTMPEAQQVGLYFLVGDSEDPDESSVYIGQSGAVGARLAQHHKEKDFWNRALVVISLTNSLTQTHALFLEWNSIREAQLANRYAVQNGTAGTKPHTPAPLEADCLEIFATARTLLATLGQPIFEPLARPDEPSSSDELFYCKTSKYDAVGQYTEEGFVVLKGSKARKDATPAMANTNVGKRRQAMIADGALKLEGDFYIFQKDVLFKTPSGAGDAVTGASVNGWTLWKSKAGKTLDELKRQTVAT